MFVVCVCCLCLLVVLVSLLVCSLVVSLFVNNLQLLPLALRLLARLLDTITKSK